MSLSDDDDPFDDIELDESLLAQLDAGPSAPSQPQHQRQQSNGHRHDRPPSRVLVPQTPPADNRSHSSNLNRKRASSPDVIELSSQDAGFWEDEELAGHLDDIEQQHQTRHQHQQKGKQKQATSLPSLSSSSSDPPISSLRQRNLFGQPVPDNGALLISSQAGPSGTGVPGAQRAKRTKQWDTAARPPPGSKRHQQQPKPPSRPSAGAFSSEWGIDDIQEAQEENFAQQPQSAYSVPSSSIAKNLPSDSMKLQLDLAAAKKITYPTNMAKRDYQFNIVQRALFDNVLVALPTGLGKTFIAAVVILNFFNWYPKGKIVFVAPTRPLVAQQQSACHGICGLPWDVACEMTGNTTKARRGDEWDEKRIFYMTPQTLDNDIKTGDVDPRDIICLVVDEAHRATGNYAYCQIVAQMQAVNPYFRILALTATPGSNPERVQEVIDNLHISLIELRTEEALDIRQYIHKKHEETMVVPLTQDFRYVRELYLELMQENCDALMKHGLLPNADASTIHPFRIRSVYRERPDILAKKRYLGGLIQETAKLADARHHLDIFSVRMFRSRAQDVLDSLKKQDQKKMKLAQVLNLAASIQDQMHPKMTAAIDVIIEHFQKEAASGNPETRVMVFCSLRECVHEIVELLNAQDNLKATPFIGQAADRQGRGLTQKQQKEIIEKYKEGVYNIIVATSIGEEGLDIGEVDLIVCYEAVKDSIRMLQRVGRTGRKRDGRIVVLMAEGPESLIWQRSKDTYKGVQQTITAGQSVTLFDDVPRLVPPSIKPVVSFEELDQPEFRPEMIGQRKKANAKSAKNQERSKKRKQRHSDTTRNVPEGALLGFLSASALKKRKGHVGSMQEGDDEDEAPSTSAEASGNRARALSDDSDDEEIERGLSFGVRGSKQSERREASHQGQGLQVEKSSQYAAEDQSTPQMAAPIAARPKGRKLGTRRDMPKTPLAVESSGPDSSPPHDELPSSLSPPAPTRISRFAATSNSAKLPDDPREIPAALLSSQESLDDEFGTSWSFDGDALGDLTQQIVGHEVHEPRNQILKNGDQSRALSKDRMHPLIASLAAQEGMPIVPADSPAMPSAGAGQESRQAGTSRSVRGIQPQTALHTQESPLPVKKPRRTISTVPVLSSPVDVAGDDSMGPPALPARRRFRRPVAASSQEEIQTGDAGSANKQAEISAMAKTPKKARKKKKKIIGRSPTSRALFGLEAERDTDEENRRGRRADSDDEGISTDEADSSDLEHVGDFQPTQAPQGYNQTSIYHQSLMSQAAPSPFRRRTVGGFVGGRYGPPITPDTSGLPRRRVPNSGNRSSPMRDDGDEDTYSLGSFVCEDDEEIAYLSDADDGLDEDD
ncbi:unnamed protein product [Sympodiomycopsis kandeliae]